jgi:hypothetical protein
MQKRCHSEPHSFKDRIEEEKKRLQEQADLLPRGLMKTTLLEKIQQLDTANDMYDWLCPPGLQLSHRRSFPAL